MIAARAAYRVGHLVILPRMRGFEVMLRQWAFKKGDVLYLIGNPRLKMSGERWYDQCDTEAPLLR